MKKILALLQAVCLVAGILILGWAATHSTDDAYAGTWCANDGDECILQNDRGTWYMEEVEPFAY